MLAQKVVQKLYITVNYFINYIIMINNQKTQKVIEMLPFVTDIKFDYKNSLELIIIPQSYFKNIKVFFERLGYEYSGHTAQFNKQITDLNNDINQLQSIIHNKDDLIDNPKKHHQLELDNKNLEINKNEEIYKAKFESLQFQLQYKDLLLQYKDLLLQNKDLFLQNKDLLSQNK